MCIFASDHFLRVWTHVVSSFLDVGRRCETNEVCRFANRTQHIFLTVDGVVRAIVFHSALEVSGHHPYRDGGAVGILVSNQATTIATHSRYMYCPAWMNSCQHSIYFGMWRG